MTPIDLVRLTALRDRTSGSPDVVVGLIDGPVAVDRPDLANENISPNPGKPDGAQEFSPQKGPPALPRFARVVHLLSFRDSTLLRLSSPLGKAVRGSEQTAVKHPRAQARKLRNENSSVTLGSRFSGLFQTHEGCASVTARILQLRLGRRPGKAFEAVLKLQVAVLQRLG